MPRHLVCVLSVALLACTTPREPSDTLDPEPEPERVAAAPAESVSAWSDATELVRGPGHDVDITEVWLDPQATAALTLDGRGEVRLWPKLAPEPGEGQLRSVAPIRVPLHEPAALSFTRTDSGSFVVAAIDTIQAGRVVEIRVDEAGRAELIERFTIPPSDPLFELHVLEGGERLLALGVDHRVRLYDREGRILTELSEHGFAPWQLRIVGRGESLKLAAVLAGPTRVQPLELRDDQLEIVGEARRVRNDRGPNLNDLQLTPDGRAVTSFRRPTSKSHEWSLELIDLASGERRVMKGEVDGKIRPRLHLVDEQRALLEDGNGFGYWIDLAGGMAQPPDFLLPDDLDDLPAEAFVAARRVPLASSIRRDRWHASVVEGMRAVPDGRALVLDPLESDIHHRLGHTSVDMLGAGFSADGSKVAWALGGRRLAEPVGERGELQVIAEGDSSFVWSTEASIAAVDGRGRVYEGETGREPTLTLRDSQGGSTAIDIDRGRLELVLPSPDGSALAVVQRKRSTEFRGMRRGPDILELTLFTIAELPEPARREWSIELVDQGYDVVWSAQSDKLAIAEHQTGGLVLSRAGEVLVERRHGELYYTEVSDAEVGGLEAAAEAQRQRIEREQARANSDRSSEFN